MPYSDSEGRNIRMQSVHSLKREDKHTPSCVLNGDGRTAQMAVRPSTLLSCELLQLVCFDHRAENRLFIFLENRIEHLNVIGAQHETLRAVVVKRHRCPISRWRRNRKLRARLIDNDSIGARRQHTADRENYDECSSSHRSPRHRWRESATADFVIVDARANL